MVKRYALFLVLTGFWAMQACTGDRLFEEYYSITTLSWDIADTATFHLPKDLPEGPTLLSVRYNQDYEYRNLYLRYVLKDSSDQILENQLVNIPLFESRSGKPLGKGFGSTYVKFDTLPIIHSGSFNSVQLIQYMRVDELPGIEALGLKKLKP